MTCEAIHKSIFTKRLVIRVVCCEKTEQSFAIEVYTDRLRGNRDIYSFLRQKIGGALARSELYLFRELIGVPLSTNKLYED